MDLEPNKEYCFFFCLYFYVLYSLSVSFVLLYLFHPCFIFFSMVECSMIILVIQSRLRTSHEHNGQGWRISVFWSLLFLLVTHCDPLEPRIILVTGSQDRFFHFHLSPVLTNIVISNSVVVSHWLMNLNGFYFISLELFMSHELYFL